MGPGDLPAGHPHRVVAPTLRFGRRLADRGVPIWVRFVLVPGLTDAEENVAGIADFAAGLDTVQRVEVLPFHRLGAHKYAELGLTFPSRRRNRPPRSWWPGSGASSPRAA